MVIGEKLNIVGAVLNIVLFRYFYSGCGSRWLVLDRATLKGVSRGSKSHWIDAACFELFVFRVKRDAMPIAQRLGFLIIIKIIIIISRLN